MPVVLPPGRARDTTSPCPTMSSRKLRTHDLPRWRILATWRKSGGIRRTRKNWWRLSVSGFTLPWIPAWKKRTFVMLITF
jgi:hypothetical protein